MENALLEINPFGGQRNRKDLLGGFVARGPAWLCATPIAHGAEGPKVLYLTPLLEFCGVARKGWRAVYCLSDPGIYYPLPLGQKQPQGGVGFWKIKSDIFWGAYLKKPPKKNITSFIDIYSIYRFVIFQSTTGFTDHLVPPSNVDSPPKQRNFQQKFCDIFGVSPPKQHFRV